MNSELLFCDFNLKHLIEPMQSAQIEAMQSAQIEPIDKLHLNTNTLESTILYMLVTKANV